jgi:hypothetical protein
MKKHLKSGQKLVKAKKPIQGFPDGVDIYVIPADKKFSKLSEDEKEEYFMSWYAELPDKCAC